MRLSDERISAIAVIALLDAMRQVALEQRRIIADEMDHTAIESLTDGNDVAAELRRFANKLREG